MSELRNTTAPAGWYPDPHGLPQQRWWAGDQWTHAVAPSQQQPERAPQVTAQSTPRETFALPATASVQQEFPTRRQLREQAAREAAAASGEPHPAAPFEMPAAPTPAPSQHAEITPPAASLIETPPRSAVASVAPAALQPTIVHEHYTPPALPTSVFPPPVASQQVIAGPPIAAPSVIPTVTPTTTPTVASASAPKPAWLQPAAAQAPAVSPIVQPVAVATTQFPPSNAAQPVYAPPQVATQQSPAPSPLALAAAAPASTQSSWPFQTPQGSGFDAPAEVPYQPFGMKQSVTAGVSAPPDRVQTWEAWAIAILPLVMAAVGVLVVSQLGDFYTVFMQGGLLFIFALVTIVLAVRDKRALVAYGHSRTASPAWILLTPLVYLLVRSVNARGSAGRESAPLLLWLVCTAIIVGAAFAFPDWLARFVSTTALF